MGERHLMNEQNTERLNGLPTGHLVASLSPQESEHTSARYCLFKRNLSCTGGWLPR